MLAPDPFRSVEFAYILEEGTVKLRHDLRNKLSGIQNMAFYLSKQVANTSLSAQNPLIREFFDDLDSNVHIADALLDQLATITGALLAGDSLGPTSVEECVHRAIKACRLADPASFDVKVQAAELLVEPASMCVAVRALLENAAEATAGRGTVTVSGSPRQDRYVIEVVDSGPGVGNTDRAMTAFFTTKEGHVGLGLNVARRVAARHKGELTLSDGPRGATATLLVPRLPEEGTA